MVMQLLHFMYANSTIMAVMNISAIIGAILGLLSSIGIVPRLWIAMFAEDFDFSLPSASFIKRVGWYSLFCFGSAIMVALLGYFGVVIGVIFGLIVWMAGVWALLLGVIIAIIVTIRRRRRQVLVKRVQLLTK